MSPAPARSGPRAPGLSEAVGAFLVGILLSSLAAQIAADAVGYRIGSGGPLPVAVLVAELVGLWLAMLGGTVVYSRYRATGHLAEDVTLKFRLPFDLLIGAVAGLGSQKVLIPLLYYPFVRAYPSLQRRLDAPARTDTAAAHGVLQIAILVLVLAFGAGLVEEVFFRGLLMRSLSRWLGPTVGVVGSAVVFGLAHFELVQLPGLIVFGLILGGLAQRTGRLGPGIVAHVTFNLLPVLTLTLNH